MYCPTCRLCSEESAEGLQAYRAAAAFTERSQKENPGGEPLKW
ncbi:MAG: hypothetical protein AAF944_18485 [Bacteroidota bacterium]